MRLIASIAVLLAALAGVLGLSVASTLREADAPLTLFGWIERQMGARLDVFENWRWDDELIDLVRWVGWIPFAIWLGRRFKQ